MVPPRSYRSVGRIAEYALLRSADLVDELGNRAVEVVGCVGEREVCTVNQVQRTHPAFDKRSGLGSGERHGTRQQELAHQDVQRRMRQDGRFQGR